MKPKLVLFDLDGTLLNTIADLSEAVNHALKLRDLPLHSLEEITKMVGHGVRNLITQALPAELRDDTATVDAVLTDFTDYYFAHIDVYTQPYPGIPELITALHRNGILLAVASNKFQAGTEYLIKEFFPDIPFVAVLGNRPGFPLKPDPEIVGEVLRKAGVKKEDAVMVGDSPTDMRTAANGGIMGIAVGWGYRDMKDMTNWGISPSTLREASGTAGSGTEFHVVETVEELKKLLLP
jgi:phosphoglycolate phosphatase